MNKTATATAKTIATEKYDRIISELMDALDLIRREAEKAEPSRHYIPTCGGARQ